MGRTEVYITDFISQQIRENISIGDSSLESRVKLLLLIVFISNGLA